MQVETLSRAIFARLARLGPRLLLASARGFFARFGVDSVASTAGAAGAAAAPPLSASMSLKRRIRGSGFRSAKVCSRSARSASRRSSRVSAAASTSSRTLSESRCSRIQAWSAEESSIAACAEATSAPSASQGHTMASSSAAQAE